MKRLFVAAAAVAALGGCVAVPAHHTAEAYYYPAPPTVSVGAVYSVPVYRTYRAPRYYYPRYHHRPHHHRW